ncbi:hypothetical protein Pmar_PMAR015919 [Perkinsus marinus ATCC 50983]|uniref:Uncharacterized protein n=1 Tax=Perkinsus marinus (strain ATCC 50983 / TXsc) TaxID=423536 RepID=C5L434_PERM5|nr:hypothetical protein Pmar_PMAR015919 [Perkinsus marinus ATCC 50983]EER08500.1 hypothetical protein Pmar_PMAR015919 [Perkinsus marinus ATCC 50983]|eukprot:XP_002776684.1 hypothetical protein Pmar_PMAR015919 [Perkinsus marinus ATCC 50983]
MVCKPLFKRDGDVCVRDERLYMASHHMAASLAEHLAERRGDYECYKTRYQLDQDEAKRYLRVKCWEARRLGNKDFEAAFKLMLSESLPSEFGNQVVHTAGGTFWSLKSSKRIHCQIVEAMEMWSNRRWARKSALEAVTACTRLGSDGSIRGIRVRDLAVEVLHWPEGKVRTYMDELAKEEADVQSSGDGEYWSDAAVKRLVATSKEGGRGYRMF